MDLCCIRCDRIHCVHICRKFFDLHLNCICRCTCMLFCVGSYDRDRITKLENLFVAEYRTLKSVCLIVFRKHYKTIDLVGSACCLNVLRCNNTNNSRHTLCFCCIDTENICVRNLCLRKCKTKGSLRHL